MTLLVLLLLGQADPCPTSLSANGPITIGSVQAGADAPGLVIHELVLRPECHCYCDSTPKERRLTRLLLAAEWRAYKWTDLREYADWLYKVERRMEVR